MQLQDLAEVEGDIEEMQIVADSMRKHLKGKGQSLKLTHLWKRKGKGADAWAIGPWSLGHFLLLLLVVQFVLRAVFFKSSSGAFRKEAIM